jgi:hypothetical protein
MALVGTGGAFIAAVFAELGGNNTTRPFTRAAFASVVLLDAGLSLSGLSTWGSQVVGVVL